MNELVYLFELDSIRNSPREILRGQQAMFREIALKGNQVVLSFNQLTDSASFLSAVHAPETAPQIAALFSLGALKYSRFVPGSYSRAVNVPALSRELAACRQQYQDLFDASVLKEYGILPDRSPQRIVRTGSHYIQNAVERCLNATDAKFLFSALPFRSNNKPMLSAIHYALQYSDPSILEEFRSAAGETDGEADQRLAFAKAYVELILRLSREPLAYHPAMLTDHPALTVYLRWVLARCSPDRPLPGLPLAPLLRKGAEQIQDLWETVAAGNITARSSWHAAFLERANSGGDRDALAMAEAVVDLCYNYTVAASIQGLSRDYGDEDQFWEDFLLRLPGYWEDGQTGVHQFLRPDSTAPAALPDQQELPPWDTAVRLIRHIPQKLRRSACGRWGRRIAASLFTQMRSAAAYILLFVAVSFLLDLAENQFVALTQQVLNPYLLSCGNIVLFGLIGSQISSWLHLLDILDSFRQFGAALRDSVVLLRFRRQDRRSL